MQQNKTKTRKQGEGFSAVDPSSYCPVSRKHSSPLMVLSLALSLSLSHQWQPEEGGVEERRMASPLKEAYSFIMESICQLISFL